MKMTECEHPNGFRMVDGKPRGDCVYKYSPSDWWTEAETASDSDDDLLRDFRERLRLVPKATRKALEDMWRFEYERRDDGGLGYFVTDHLWHAFRDIRRGRSPHEMGERMGHSTSYVHALCRALEST